MPINDKIINEIKECSAWDEKFKKLLIDILTKEEQTYRYKKEFETLVDEYLKKGGNSK